MSTDRQAFGVYRDVESPTIEDPLHRDWRLHERPETVADKTTMNVLQREPPPSDEPPVSRILVVCLSWSPAGDVSAILGVKRPRKV
jgi:hypothetical protein